MTSGDADGVSREPLRHEALHYSDAAEYDKHISGRVQVALSAGEPVLVAVPQPRLDRLRDVIRLACKQAGQEPEPGADGVTFVDIAESGRNPGRLLPQLMQAFVDAYPERRPLLVSEVVWPERNPEEYAAAVQHEALVNLALAGRNVSVLCPYDIGTLPPAWVRDASRTHPLLTESGFSRPSPQFRDAASVAAEFNRPLGEPPTDAERLDFSAPSELQRLRNLVLDYGLRAGLVRDRAEDLRAAVNEVATNTLVHTDAPGVLYCWSTETYVVCEIRDRGVVNDPLFARRAPAEAQIGGHGLMMVHQLCDLVRTYTGEDGVVVRMHVVKS